MPAVRKPWWQQATALVTVTTGGVISGFNFVPGTAAAMTSPASVPVHLLALEQAANSAAAGRGSAGVASDAQLRTAIVNVARYYLQLAQTRTPAQMEALIWDKTSSNGADHGQSCAAFASLTLELAAQAVGQQSWVSGGSSYPWPLHAWADVRVDTNPASPGIESLVADAQGHGRWHAAGGGYQPQAGDWVVFDNHVEVVTGYSDGVLRTIGADSEPGLTVNEHAFTGSLAADGVAGFVDNGGLKAAGTAPSSPAPRSSSAATAASTTTAGASVPGVPAEADLLGGATEPGPPASTPVTAAVPGILRAAAAGASSSAGQASSAVIPGAALAAESSGTTGTAAASGGKAATAGSSRAAAKPASSSSASPASASAAKPAYATPGTSAQQDFISSVAPGAQAAQQRYGVPAAVTIAQAIEESAWGSSALSAQYHNLFGIKGAGTAGSVSLPTSEYLNGQWVTINAEFRAYRNNAESIADHAELLATSGYYTRAMADRGLPDAFANDLTGVYATDPNYGANLIALMKLYNLYRFDSAGTAAKASVTIPSSAPAAAAQAPATSAASSSSPATASRAARSAARVPGLTTPTLAPASRPVAAPATDTAQTSGGRARVPGLVTPGPLSPRTTAATGRRPASGRTGTRTTAVYTTGVRPAPGPPPARYPAELPTAMTTAFFASAKAPLARSEYLYRDVAAGCGIAWELLAAADWMECRADPRRSPVHGEKLGAVNPDGSMYATKSQALSQCGFDLLELAGAVYGISLNSRRRLSVRALAAAFTAFRWGAILRRQGVSPMEFPYSVAGLTAAHHKMHWPDIDAPDAPDRPGARFREPFGAVPVILSLGYQATV